MRVGDLASISYYTNKSGDQNSVDWYVVIYTKPYAGGDGSWYGNRLNAEPMYSASLNAPAGQWNRWSTGSGDNQLRFFDQARTYMGFYDGPTLADIVAGPINWGSYPSSGCTAVMDYSDKEVLSISFQVGSGWANGFTGLIDAIEITLKDGSAVLVDLENVPEVWVDATYDASTPGWGVTKFASIQDGIAAVDAGGTVNVAEGSYEANNVAVNKAVTIQGAGAGTIITAGERPDLFVVTASGTAFKDMTVQMPASKRRAIYVKASVEGLVVERMTFQGGEKALEIQGTPIFGVTLTDCRLVDVRVGIRSGSYVLVDGLTVTGCVFEGGPSTDTQNYAIGIYQASDGNIGQMRNVIITGNTFRNLNPDSHPGSGIYVEELANARIADNVFENCCRAFYIYKEYNSMRPVSDVTVENNVFRGCQQSGIELRNSTVFNTIAIRENSFQANAMGVRAYGEGTGWDSVTIAQNSFVGNTIAGVGVLTGLDPAGEGLGGARLLARNNWWGSASGPGPVGPGTGDRVHALVDYDPWLGKPVEDNVLFLQPTDASIYVKPSETVVVDLNVANLQQPVAALQAMLNFSSTYFQAGPGKVNVAAGGGVWDELIYNVWTAGGDLDVAVGVKFDAVNPGAGTQADATTAIITLTPTGTEGTTRVVFRPDANPDHGLVASTFLADCAGKPVWPAKLDSATICIDGTAPENVTIVADPAGWTNANSVVLTFSATDALAGIDHYELQVDSGDFVAQVSPYTLDVSALADGEHTVTVKAIDRAGNEATAVTTIYLDKTNPTIDGLTATQPRGAVTAPTIDGVIASGEWAAARQIVVASDKGTVSVLSDAQNLYVLFDLADPTDARTTYPNEIGNDQIGINVNPTQGGAWGFPYDLIFQTSAPAPHQMPWNPKVSSGDTDGWVSQLLVNNTQVPLPAGLITKTVYADGRRVTEWQIPLSLVGAGASSGDTLMVGGAVDIGDGGSYAFPVGLNWQDAGTFASATVNPPQPVDVLDCANTTFQGVVNISVQSDDSVAGLAAEPLVTVERGGDSLPVTFIGQDPAGTFHYQVVILAATANGEWTITAVATDQAGNSASTSGTLCVNKNQVTGQVELDSFVGSSREVTFVATGGAVKTWTQTLTFTNSVAEYTLTDVPDGTTGISAKTAWSLRNKLAVMLDDDGQASADFTGGEMLLGGDLNDSNSINTLDYSLLKAYWFTTSPEADINGDGVVNNTDYSIQKTNWFLVGDEE